MSGTFILRDGLVRRDDTGCHGTGAHADVGTGGSVTVTDPDGRIVGAATLSDDPSRPDRSTAAAYLECDYQFRIEGLPDLPAYQVELPGFGSTEYQREEFRALATRMVFSIGSGAPDEAGIPGLTVPQVADSLGLACDKATLAVGEVVPWVCLASDARARYGALVSATQGGRVLAIQAVVAQDGATPSDAVALPFIARVAALPYTGAQPDLATAWVTDLLATGGETEIGGVRLSMGNDWPPATRGLSLETAQG